MEEIPTPKGDESTVIIDVNPLHRVPLVFLNLLMFAINCMVVFVCVVSMVDRRHEISFSNRSLLVSFVVNIEVTVVVLSSLLLFISFMGFMGALRENVCFLTWYICGIRVLLMLNGLFLAACYLVPLVGTSSAKQVFNIDLIVSYRDNPDYARIVDYAQASFECCGVTSDRYLDWDHNMYFNCSKFNPSPERCSVPASCCRPPEGEHPSLEQRLKHRFCGRGVLNVSQQETWKKIYTRNCVDATVSYLRSNTIIVFVVGMVITVVLTVLRKMATTVQDEIISLTCLYDRYYHRMAAGCRPSLARREVLEEVAAAKDCFVTKEAKPGAKYQMDRQSPEVGQPSVDAEPPPKTSPAVSSSGNPRKPTS